MPLVRIDLPAGKPAAYRAMLGDVVYDAMVRTMNVPQNDRFQVIAEHAPGGLVVDPTYLGIQRSADCIIVQVTMSEGRTVAVKQAFYKAVVEGLKERLGLRPEDVFINLIEVLKENWSFGQGEAQYVT